MNQGDEVIINLEDDDDDEVDDDSNEQCFFDFCQRYRKSSTIRSKCDLEAFMIELNKHLKVIRENVLTPKSYLMRISDWLCDTFFKFYQQYQALQKTEITGNTHYFENMTQLIANFFSLRIKLRLEYKLTFNDILKHYCMLLEITLENNPVQIINTLIQIIGLNKDCQKIFDPLFRSVLKNDCLYQNNTPVNYCRLILAYRMWKFIYYRTDEKKFITKLAMRKLRVPLNFREHQLCKILCNVPPDKEITNYLMVSGYNTLTVVKEFFKYMKENGTECSTLTEDEQNIQNKTPAEVIDLTEDDDRLTGTQFSTTDFLSSLTDSKMDDIKPSDLQLPKDRTEPTSPKPNPDPKIESFSKVLSKFCDSCSSSGTSSSSSSSEKKPGSESITSTLIVSELPESNLKSGSTPKEYETDTSKTAPNRSNEVSDNIKPIKINSESPVSVNMSLNMNITGLRKATSLNGDQMSKKLDKKPSITLNDISYENNNKENNNDISSMQLNKATIEITVIEENSTDNVICCNPRSETTFDKPMLKRQNEITMSDSTNEIFSSQLKHQKLNEEACSAAEETIEVSIPESTTMSTKEKQPKSILRKESLNGVSSSTNDPCSSQSNHKRVSFSLPGTHTNCNVSSIRNNSNSAQPSTSYRNSLLSSRSHQHSYYSSQSPNQRSESSIIILNKYDKCSPSSCLPTEITIDKPRRVDRSMISHVLASSENFSKVIGKCSQISDTRLGRGRHRAGSKHSTKASIDKLPSKPPSTCNGQPPATLDVDSALSKSSQDETQLDKKILPLKKRKLTSDELEKYEKWKQQDNNISYPPIQMISIAELEDMKRCYSARQFKTPGELKAVPPLPADYNLPISEVTTFISNTMVPVNVNVNNHTFNSTNVNYHVNGLVPIVNFNYDAPMVVSINEADSTENVISPITDYIKLTTIQPLYVRIPVRTPTTAPKKGARKLKNNSTHPKVSNLRRNPQFLEYFRYCTVRLVRISQAVIDNYART